MRALERALIVGGGTAGLGCAIALRRAGVEAEIVEIKESWDVLGSGVTMMSATLRALGELGLADECVARGAGCDEVGIYDAAANLLETVPVASIAGPGIPAMAGIMRPELHDILATAARGEGSDVRLGTVVESLDIDTDGARVRLSDGSEAVYDLVVAADGIHSGLRDRFWGDSFRARLTGQTVWRALIPRPPAYAELAMFYGPRSKCGINAVSASRAYLFLNTAGTERPPRERWPSLVREFLADFEGPVEAVRESIDDPELVDCRPLQANLVPAPWNRGPVLLVGDAAHAPTPQIAMGAGLAIEDAVVLGDLAAAGLSVDDLLARFNQRRFARCRMAVDNSLQLDRWEKDHGDPGADPGGLSAATWAALAEPI